MARPDITAYIAANDKAFHDAMQRVRRDARGASLDAKQSFAGLTMSVAGYGRSMVAGFTGMLAGIGAGALSALAPLALLDTALKTINDAGRLVDVADRIGLTTTALQELSFGFSQAGVEQATFETGMAQFSKRIAEAAVKGGTLADILKANGVAIRDGNGQIRGSADLLRDYADLVKNAATEQEKMLLVTEAFGRGGADFINALNDGKAGIDGMKKAAADAGGVIDEQLLRRAEEMGDRWEAAWRRFTVNARSAILTAVEGMDGLGKMMADFEKRRAVVDLGALAGGLVGKPGDVMTTGKGARPSGLDARMAGALTTELSATDQKLVNALQARYQRAAAKATIIPSPKEKGGGGSKSTPKTADDRVANAIQAIEDRIAALKEEQAVLGLSFEAQTKRRVALDLEQDALRLVREEARRKGDQDWQNAQLSAEQVRKINEVSEAYAKQAEALRQAQEQQDFNRDALKGAFDDLRSALKDGELDWKDLGDIASGVLDKVIDKIENDLVDAILQSNSALSGGGGFWSGLLKLFGFGGGSSFNPTSDGFAKMLGLADGGTVRGPGGPTGDKIPALLSDGEHVTRSAMAKKHAPLLAAINADKLPHFADGGFVSPQMTIPQIPAAVHTPAPTSSITIAPQINVDARNAQPGVGAEVKAAVKEATDNMTPLVVKALREIKIKGISV